MNRDQIIAFGTSFGVEAVKRDWSMGKTVCLMADPTIDGHLCPVRSLLKAMGND